MVKIPIFIIYLPAMPSRLVRIAGRKLDRHLMAGSVLALLSYGLLALAFRDAVHWF